MNSFDRLKQQLRALYSLTILQRGVRLSLRAVWLGIAGVLLGWGVNALWGWLPDPTGWLFLGLIFALMPLGGFLFSLTTPSRWVRTIDQKQGHREEVNTAWEISRKKQRGVINDLLVRDVLVRMPKVRAQTLRDGWFREIDLAATLILLVLACTLFFSLLLQPANPQANDPPAEEVPVTAQQPEQEQGLVPGEQQSGQGEQPGENAAQDGTQTEDGQATGNEPGNGSGADGQTNQDPGSLTSPDMGAIAEALRNLGTQLSQQAGTYDLGQAFENMDLDGAADELEDLGSQLNELSPESRDNLSQSLENAAGALDHAGEQSLSEDMGNAAEALSESNEEANQALGEVAGDLRELGDAMRAMDGAGAGAATQKGDGANTGNPEPLSRLNEEGGELNLPLEPDSAPQSELLGPASPDAIGEGTANGSMDSANQPGADSVQSPLLPNSLLWKWRDVISQYFQR